MNFLIDVDGGLSRLRGNEKLFKRLLGTFLASTEFDALKASLAQGDYVRSDELAHAIKGMTGNLSLNALFEISAKLMNECRVGAPNDATVEEFWQVTELTVRAVNEYLSG